MKKKKVMSVFVLLGLLFLFVPIRQVNAQMKRSNISIHSGAYYTNHLLFPRYRDHDFLLLMGINYKFYVKRRLAVIVDYTFTTNQPYWTIGVAPYVFSSPRDLVSFYHTAANRGYYYDPTGVGKLVNRMNYHFFDLGGSYVFFIKKKQKISGLVGLSYAYGRNKYITVLRFAAPGGDWYYSDYVIRWKGYIGGFVGLSYDYMLWENRINVGIDVTGRKYEGSFPLFMNYGFHAGYNF